eukprot:CAMPEP_0194516044 /NCGR_PEP_ID=MMETSP0253-20130528/48834_1 /TAXON_ID=2966 /ORGANISM="Noctiluca scintillans" /LENGTH=108 /DNA_ID=CAMNT_0039359853 /DNA_START=95 /DNA_END=421 /DNA_ORIENTATION=-
MERSGTRVRARSQYSLIRQGVQPRAYGEARWETFASELFQKLLHEESCEGVTQKCELSRREPTIPGTSTISRKVTKFGSSWSFHKALGDDPEHAFQGGDAYARSGLRV